MNGRIESIPKKLAARLRTARNAAQPVEKKGKADEGYDFVRAVDVNAEARRLLKSRDIVVVPSVEEVEQKVGKSGVLVHAHLTFEIVLVSTGESITKHWVGSGFDFWPADKALYKAITGGTKYFYANLLGIPFGIDPEEGTTELADAPPEEDVAEPTVIDPSRVSRICAGITDSSLLTCDVVEMLTELGVWVEEGTGASRVVDAVKRLSPEQADEVEAHLGRRAQDDAALAPDPEPAGVA